MSEQLHRSETSLQNALVELRSIKDSYRRFIRDNFEFAAKDCQACPTFGACCLDQHFVNVHITKLEAAAINETLRRKLSDVRRETVRARIKETVEKYNLTDGGDTFGQTFACPLFEPGIGCLVHAEAKPVACISHACYESPADLPPDCLQHNVERKIERLNREVYGADWRWLPLPVQLTVDI